MKKVLIFIAVVLAVCKIFIQDIRPFLYKYSLERQEYTVTQQLSLDEVSTLLEKQNELINTMGDKKKKEWLIKEMNRGFMELFEHYEYMVHHPEYDLIEIEPSITQYVDRNGNVIEFYSHKGKIKRVHSSYGWEPI